MTTVFPNEISYCADSSLAGQAALARNNRACAGRSMVSCGHVATKSHFAI